MKTMLTRFICVVILVSVMSACSFLQPPGTATDIASLQNQRAANAELSLSQLQEIDTLIKLDNDWLAGQIESELLSQAAANGKFSFRKFKLKFSRQVISLVANIEISDQQNNIIN